jgi:hypothetical protein
MKHENGTTVRVERDGHGAGNEAPQDTKVVGIPSLFPLWYLMLVAAPASLTCICRFLFFPPFTRPALPSEQARTERNFDETQGFFLLFATEIASTCKSSSPYRQMKFSAVLVVAALCLGRCRTIAAAALPQRDYPFSDDAGTPPPQPTGRSNGLRWREKGLVTVIVGGTLLHVVRILGKNRVIRELQGLLENNQLRTDEKLKSSRAAYKKALSESNKDRSFKSSSHTINLDMAQDRLMMKCILEKLGLAEVVGYITFFFFCVIIYATLFFLYDSPSQQC